MKLNRIQSQKGFTLVELLAVAAGLAILGALVLPKIRDAFTPVTATQMLSSTEDIHAAWKRINDVCRRSTTVSGSPIPDTGKTVQDVLFGGLANVATAYQTCYKKSQVVPLADIGQPTSTAGVYSVGGATLTMSGGGPTTPVSYALATLSDDVTLEMAQNYTPTLSALLTSDTTSSVVRYSTATSSMRTVTVLKQ